VVREGAAAVGAALAGVGRAAVAVCDAEEERDLRVIAEGAAAIDREIVWSGSAGLARHLPAALRLAPSGEAVLSLPPLAGPILVLVGSRSSVAREQARRLSGEAGVRRVELDPRGLLEGGPGEEKGRDALARALGTGEDVVAVLGDAQLDLARGPDLAAALGRIAAPLAGGLAGLVATGGDIARAALAALGAHGIRLVGEVEPGVPLGVADAARPLAVITKAGAFGSPETLSRCRGALAARRASGPAGQERGRGP
jgi:4-hydroxythreonine-4-phosphate dehydrogenase